MHKFNKFEPTLPCLSPTSDKDQLTENSSATPRPRREKANLHPGRLVLDTQMKRCTLAEKHTADLHAKEIQAARNAAIQQGCAWVSEMEETMEVEQAEQATAKVKPVRPK